MKEKVGNGMELIIKMPETSKLLIIITHNHKSYEQHFDGVIMPWFD